MLLLAIISLGCSILSMIIKTASIHDTSPAEDAPEPISVAPISIHEIEKDKTEVYESLSEMRFSASIKDDLDIIEK